jgi:hypothetical protein
MTLNVKEGETVNKFRSDVAMTYNMVRSNCLDQAECALVRDSPFFDEIDITCAENATSCAVGTTCSAGSMAADGKLFQHVPIRSHHLL